MSRSHLLAAVLIGAVTLVSGTASNLPAADPQYVAILTVKNMCCAKESVPAIRELSKLPGVGRVFVDYKTRSVLIEPGAKGVLSPRSVWEIAERIKIEPIRLATAEDVYTSKPRR